MWFYVESGIEEASGVSRLCHRQERSSCHLQHMNMASPTGTFIRLLSGTLPEGKLSTAGMSNFAVTKDSSWKSDGDEDMAS